MLDIAKDRYFALPDRLAEIFRLCIDTVDEPPHTDEVAHLRDLGLLALQGKRIDLPSPNSDIEGIGRGTINPLILAEALVRKFAATWQVKHRRFFRNIEALEKLKAANLTSDPTSLATLASVMKAYRAATTLRSDNDRCLELSIAAFKALIVRGIDVNLIIGVSVPFAAHCWVQHKNTVLTDNLDVVLRYEPILVV